MLFRIAGSGDGWQSVSATPGVNVALENLEPDTRYEIQLMLEDAPGRVRQPSNSIYISTIANPDQLDAAPYDLAAIAEGTGFVEIQWNDRTDRESGFEIQRTAPGLPGDIWQVATDTTTFRDDSVTPGVTYTYE